MGFAHAFSLAERHHVRTAASVRFIVLPNAGVLLLHQINPGYKSSPDVSLIVVNGGDPGVGRIGHVVASVPEVSLVPPCPTAPGAAPHTARDPQALPALSCQTVPPRQLPGGGASTQAPTSFRGEALSSFRILRGSR